MMRCVFCRRPLFKSAAPGLHVGPKCAKDRNLLPDKPARSRRVEDLGREIDPRQVDWVNLSNSAPIAMQLDSANLRSIILERPSQH
jgi:hypothetical protein